MATYTLTVYACDEEGCGATVVANSGAEARTEAAQQGWSVADTADIKCRTHRTYPACEECGRPMRPHATAAALHPGTIAPGSNGWCNVCAENERKGAGNRARLDRAVEKYLMFRGPEFAYLFHGVEWKTSEVDRARKAAPEDTWAALGL